MYEKFSWSQIIKSPKTESYALFKNEIRVESYHFLQIIFSISKIINLVRPGVLDFPVIHCDDVTKHPG